jgi:hypothetical protein
MADINTGGFATGTGAITTPRCSTNMPPTNNNQILSLPFLFIHLVEFSSILLVYYLRDYFSILYYI